MKKYLSLMLALVMVFSLFGIIKISADEIGTIYYVDAENGDDSNNGESPIAAWKTIDKVNSFGEFAPGDKILFKRGDTFSGNLWAKGSGTESAPITVGAYGDESDPLPYIKGNGSGSGMVVDAAVYTYMQDHYVIENLEVTNENPSTGAQYCIYAGAGSGKTTYDITIQNCYAHGFAENWSSNEHGGLVGIMVHSYNWSGNHDGVKILNNTVKDCKDDGIVTQGSYCGGTINGTANAKADQNIYVAGNTLSNIGGDGILVNNVNEPIVEYNVCHKAHSKGKDYAVAMWPFSARNSLFQYNESYETSSGGDSQGFDCDYQCTGTTFQYNYSHDNAGGFMLICTEAKTWDGGTAYNNDAVVRYNISQKDKGQIFSLVGHLQNTWIYNNTIYTSYTSTSTIINSSEKGSDHATNTKFLNNLFYVESGKVNFGWLHNTTFDNNLIYGRVTGSFLGNGDHILQEGHNNTDFHAKNNIYNEDPKLLDEGGAGIGFDSCKAYLLKGDSPAIDAGVEITENPSVYPCDTDFFGNSIVGDETPNIGADNSPEPQPVDNSYPLYGGSYKGFLDWERDTLGATNTAIAYLNGNCTTWLSTARLVDNENGSLSGLEGSTRAIKVTADKATYNNAKTAVSLNIPTDALSGSKGIRYWAAGGDADRSIKMIFSGKKDDGASFKYTTNSKALAGGGWVVIDFETSSFYDEVTGRGDGVDKTQLVNATELKIEIPCNPNQSYYIDDMQIFIGGVDVDEPYQINNKNLIEGVVLGTEYAEFMSKFTKNTDCEIKLVKDKEEVTAGKVGTDMVFNVINGDAVGNYSVVVIGDLSGDGEMTSADMLALKRAILMIDSLSPAQYSAGDIVKNNKLNSADLLKLKREILQKQAS
jgi:hypothetical protein